jgi:hypothetical protein
MKRVLIGIAGVVVLALVVILFVNARESTREVKKTQTEVTIPAGGPCMMQCTQSTGTKAQPCDPANCKGTNCDPSTCKGKCEKAVVATKSCDPSTCPGHAKMAVTK